VDDVVQPRPISRPTSVVKGTAQIRVKLSFKGQLPWFRPPDHRIPLKPGFKALNGPGVEEKAVWQFFRTHIDEESRTISSSPFVQDDERFPGHRKVAATLSD
jgi:hypothetical protein